MVYDFLIGYDPSVNHPGYCVLQNLPSGPRIVTSGVLRYNSKMGDARYGWMANEFYRRLAGALPITAKVLSVVEKPTYEDSERGILLARKKDLPKLFGAATVCLSVAALLQSDLAFVTAGSWKRGVEKPKIQAQIEAMYPEKAGKWATEDEWESCGIALWALMRMGQGVYEIYPAVRPQRKRKGGGNGGREG